MPPGRERSPAGNRVELAARVQHHVIVEVDADVTADALAAGDAEAQVVRTEADLTSKRQRAALGRVIDRPGAGGLVFQLTQECGGSQVALRELPGVGRGEIRNVVVVGGNARAAVERRD